jgi:hypothetical protein
VAGGRGAISGRALPLMCLISEIFGNCADCAAIGGVEEVIMM